MSPIRSILNSALSLALLAPLAICAPAKLGKAPILRREDWPLPPDINPGGQPQCIYGIGCQMAVEWITEQNCPGGSGGAIGDFIVDSGPWEIEADFNSFRYDGHDWCNCTSPIGIGVPASLVSVTLYDTAKAPLETFQIAQGISSGCHTYDTKIGGWTASIVM